MNYRFYTALLLLAPPVLIISSPLSTQPRKFGGLWLTDDREGVISITACKDKKNYYCGYLVRFPETGHKKLNKTLCGAKLIGKMKREGNRLTGGWIYDPKKDQAYNLTIKHTSSPRKIRLRAYGRNIAQGEEFIWTRYNRKSDSRKQSYWASCPF